MTAIKAFRIRKSFVNFIFNDDTLRFMLNIFIRKIIWAFPLSEKERGRALRFNLFVKDKKDFSGIYPELLSKESLTRHFAPNSRFSTPLELTLLVGHFERSRESAWHFFS